MAEPAERARALAPAEKTQDARPAAAARHAALESRPSAVRIEARAALLNARSTGPRPLPPNRTGLPERLKKSAEALSGVSLDDVRVHPNSPKPARFGAHAFAQGSDIHLASGQERHLPHELWHVVQQKQGRVRPLMQMKGAAVDPSAHLETEADVMSPRLLSHYPASADAAGTGRPTRALAAGAPVQCKLTIDSAVILAGNERNSVLKEAANAQEDYEFTSREAAVRFASAVQAARKTADKVEKNYLAVLDQAFAAREGVSDLPLAPTNLPRLSEDQQGRLLELHAQLTAAMFEAADEFASSPGAIASSAWERLKTLETALGRACVPPKKMPMHTYREKHTQGNELYVKAKTAIGDAARELDALTLAVHDRMRAKKPGTRPEVVKVIDAARGKIVDMLERSSGAIAGLSDKAKKHRGKSGLEEQATLEADLVGQLVAGKRVQERRLDALVESVESGSFAGGGPGGAKGFHIAKVASLGNPLQQDAIDSGALQVAKSANERALLLHVTARKNEHMVNKWVKDAEAEGIRKVSVRRALSFDLEEAVAGKLVAASGVLSKKNFNEVLLRNEIEQEIQSLLDKSVYPRVRDELGETYVVTAQAMALDRKSERESKDFQAVMRVITKQLADKVKHVPGAAAGVKKLSKEGQKQVAYKAEIKPKIQID
jgi:hypothetical protein